MASDVGYVQEHIYPRRIRAKDKFVDYDPLRSGKVTKPQFIRAVGQMGVQISDAAAASLADEFSSPKAVAPQVVNYKDFCETVDSVWTIPGLEKMPHTNVEKPGASMPPTFRASDVEDQSKLERALHRLALLVKTRGVELKYCFQDHERSDAASLTVPRRSGKVTIEQFWRCFPFLKELDTASVQLIIDRYTTPQGDVHYMQLHNDVKEIVDNSPPPFPTSPLVIRPDAAKWSQHQLTAVEKIQAKVVEKRVRLCEHFQDFDPLRKGFCRPGQVKTVFAILKLEVDIKDFDELASTYTREDGMFWYKGFCGDIDKAFTCVGLEKNPLARIAPLDASSTSGARRNRIQLTSEEQAWIAQLEEQIRARTRVRRIPLRTLFQDFDKTNRGHVTKSQFHRVMHMLGFEFKQAHTDLLCRLYCDLGNHQEFNYLDFCAACDPPSPHEQLAMDQTEQPYFPSQPSKYFNEVGRVTALQTARF
jgi:hypothetical protein